MPLFAYFTVIGSILIGLLYVAEAQLGPPKSLSISTNFNGLPEPWKPSKAPVILTARDAPAPEMASDAFAQARSVPRNEMPKISGPQKASAAKAPDAPQASEPPKASKVTANKPKKTRKPARDSAGRNLFAHSTAPRSNVGIVW